MEPAQVGSERPNVPGQRNSNGEGPPPEAEDFYRDQFRPVMKYLILNGASLEAAEDATQNAMIQLLRCWQQIENRPGWVRRVALNDLRDAAKRDGKAQSKAVQGGHLAAASLDIHGVGKGSDSARVVLELLAKLPPPQRDPIALVMDGLEPNEIAAVLGKPTATVRSNIRHARRKLRGELGLLFGGEPDGGEG